MAHQKKHHPKKVKHYKHLTVFERTVIEQKCREGLASPKIARLVKRDRSTIIRELARIYRIAETSIVSTYNNRDR